jgi:hypothetical protein
MTLFAYSFLTEQTYLMPNVRVCFIFVGMYGDTICNISLMFIVYDYIIYGFAELIMLWGFILCEQHISLLPEWKVTVWQEDSGQK